MEYGVKTSGFQGRGSGSEARPRPRASECTVRALGRQLVHLTSTGRTPGTGTRTSLTVPSLGHNPTRNTSYRIQTAYILRFHSIAQRACTSFPATQRNGLGEQHHHRPNTATAARSITVQDSSISPRTSLETLTRHAHPTHPGSPVKTKTYPYRCDRLRPSSSPPSSPPAPG